jgi:transcriptional regulator with XRE-family HTH domain
MDTISKRIKTALEIRDMKQADLIKLTGINKGALSSYISGKYEPKQNNIYLMAKALNVSEAWLMGKDVPMERYSYEDASPTVKKLVEETVDHQKAIEMYDLYKKAAPNIKAAVEALLKSE